MSFGSGFGLLCRHGRAHIPWSVPDKIVRKVTKLRGQFFEYQNIPVCVTYHPSALLRDNSLKRLAWEDLKFFKTKLLELNPGYESQYIPYVKQ